MAGVRIQADTGGFDGTGFRSASSELSQAGSLVDGALSAAAGAAGEAGLASALGDLAADLTAADRAAAVTAGALSGALSYASASYHANEQRISRAEVAGR